MHLCRLPLLLSWLSGALCADRALAQVLTPRVPLVERFIERVPVGGWGLVGVSADTVGKSADVSRLSVHLIRHASPLLCVTVVSIDGKYLGRAEYDVNAAVPGRYRLTFESSHSAHLLAYRPLEVAVLAELKQRCTPSHRAEAVLLSSWTDRPSTRNALVLVNSMSAHKVDLRGRACVGIANPTAVAYDMTCALTSKPGLDSVRLRRFYFDESQSTRLVIASP
jgi:hypothetical protein